MRKVYEYIDYARVGQFQAVLEEAGIATFVKNLGASMGIGEVPFHEVFPELWVMNDEDYEPAIELLKIYVLPLTGDGDGDADSASDWQCAKCGESVEGIFTECWNCSTPRVFRSQPPLPTDRQS